MINPRSKSLEDPMVLKPKVKKVVVKKIGEIKRNKRNKVNMEEVRKRQRCV